jgi:hypothetical protein
MSLRLRLLIAVAAFTLAMPAVVQGQARGRGMRGGMAMGYDKAKEVTLTGTVIDVVDQQGMGMGAGLHLMFKSGADTIEVRLGPKAWLDEQHYTFAKGDELTVTGSRQTVHDMATMTDQDTLTAREIKKGDQTMTLRDENGRPLWSGGMRGR